MTSPNFFDAVSDFRKTTDTDISLIQQNLTTQQAYTSRQPIWVSRYPQSDVTWPEFMFVAWPVTGTSGAASAGTAHTHGPGDLAATTLGYGVLKDCSLGSYVTISSPTSINQVGTYLYKSPNGALNSSSTANATSRKTSSLESK